MADPLPVGPWEDHAVPQTTITGIAEALGYTRVQGRYPDIQGGYSEYRYDTDAAPEFRQYRYIYGNRYGTMRVTEDLDMPVDRTYWFSPIEHGTDWPDSLGRYARAYSPCDRAGLLQVLQQWSEAGYEQKLRRERARQTRFRVDRENSEQDRDAREPGGIVDDITPQVPAPVDMDALDGDAALGTHIGVMHALHNRIEALESRACLRVPRHLSLLRDNPD